MNQQFHKAFRRPCDGEKLAELLRGGLSAEEEAAVEAHLSECSTCAEQLQHAAVAGTSWQEAKGMLAPDEFDGRPSWSSTSSFSLGDRDDHPSNDRQDQERTADLLIREIQGWLDPADDPQMLGRFAGYEIVGVIGHGGMGIVMKGFEPALNRYVAIKVLAPRLATNGAARTRFAREAQAAAAVLHENVVAIHRVDEFHGLPFLVMPYIAGVSLQKRIDQDGALKTAGILRIGSQIASGLAAAHDQGLIHRDIKPANILLNRGVERVTITDFGLARAMDDASVTRTGVIAGTPQYMSPEQTQAKPLDARSDLFSLGSVLYALCTGRPPFDGETAHSVMRQIAEEKPTPIRDVNSTVPRWLHEIIDSLMSKRVEDRPASAREVAELLADCLAHVQQPSSAPLPECLEQTTSWPFLGNGGDRESQGRPFSKKLGVFCMIAVFSIALLGLFLFQSKTPPDISGHWTGEGWGEVELNEGDSGSYEGTYTDTFGDKKGILKLEWSGSENRFNGTWREGKDRFGKISVRLADKEIRGAWTTSKKSRIDPGSPALADLLWARRNPYLGNVALRSRGATVDGVASHPETLLDGQTTGYHGTRGWARSLTPATWTVTLPREYPLQQIRLLLYDRDPRAFRYTIATSVDGKNYKMAADRSKEWSRSWQVLSFPQRPVRYIRVQCLDSTYNDRPREDGFFAVELEAYCHPPKPPVQSLGRPLGGSLGYFRTRSYMLEFSGRDESFVNIPELRYDGSHPITIEANVMSLYRGSIFADFEGAGLGLDVADGYCSFHVNDGRATDNGYVRVKAKTSMGRNKLVHLAGVLDGNELRLFVDGKLQGSETIGKFRPSKFPFMIGADPDGQGEPTQFLHGFVDSARVSKVARYDTDFTPSRYFESDKHTLALYHLNEGEGNIAHDASGNGLHGKILGAKWVAAETKPVATYGWNAPTPAIQRLRNLGVEIIEQNGIATEFAIGNSSRITDADLADLAHLKTLESLTLINCPNVTDAGFARLRHLTRLQRLNLSPSNITDAGLITVGGLEALWMLGLNSTQVTDQGLKHLVDNQNITVLYLNNTRITDAGLAFLEQMSDMYWMDLGGTAITDVGLAHLGHMSKMKLLSVDDTKVTDAGLRRLERFSKLELINLNRTAVSDEGIAHLAKLTSLKRVLLSDTGVTMNGLVHLTKLKNLRELQLLNTSISPASVKELRRMAPKDCRIQYSFARTE